MTVCMCVFCRDHQTKVASDERNHFRLFNSDYFCFQSYSTIFVLMNTGLLREFNFEFNIAEGCQQELCYVLGSMNLTLCLLLQRETEEDVSDVAALACFSVSPRPGDKHFPFILFLLINQNNHIAFTFRIESLLLLQVKLPQNSMYQIDV